MAEKITAIAQGGIIQQDEEQPEGLILTKLDRALNWARRRNNGHSI